MKALALLDLDWLKRHSTPLVWVMLARLLLLLLIMIILTGFTEFDIDIGSLSIFMAITVLLSIAYVCWLRREDTMQSSALYQLTVDVFIITGLVHFTGGISSTLSLLYPLVILVAGVVVSGNLASRVALLSTCLYATLIALEASGALLYRGVEAEAYGNIFQVIQLTLLQILIFAFFGAASNYLADRYIYQSRQLQRLRDMAKTTLSSVTVPLLAVENPAGRIKLANPAACQVIKKTEKEMVDSCFNDLFVDNTPSLDEAGKQEGGRQQVWWMKQADGTKFPVTLEISNGSLSGAVLNVLHDGPEDAEINLVAFQDMTQMLAKEEDIRNLEKTNTAVGMITEMAHVVRNPLTAIRGAGELINAAVEAALSKQHQITEEEFISLKSMCEIIFDQTQELNNKVESFMQYAVNDKSKLIDMINNANLWGKRVAGCGNQER